MNFREFAGLGYDFNPKEYLYNYQRAQDKAATGDSTDLRNIESGDIYKKYLEWKDAGNTVDTSKSAWGNNEYSDFIDAYNTNEYRKQKQQQIDNYNNAIGGNFFNWLTNGLSGNGWSASGYAKKRGFTNENNQNASSIDPNKLRDLSYQYDAQRGKDISQGKNLLSGIPVLGNSLSAWTQTASAGKDLLEGATGLNLSVEEDGRLLNESNKWDRWNSRDHWSDLGAAAETALDMATAGTASAALKGTKASSSIAKSAGKEFLKQYALGGVTGAANQLRETGENTTLNNLLGNAAISSAIGGTIGALTGAYGGFKNKYLEKNGLIDRYKVANQANNYAENILQSPEYVAKNFSKDSQKTIDKIIAGKLAGATNEEVANSLTSEEMVKLAKEMTDDFSKKTLHKGSQYFVNNYTIPAGDARKGYQQAIGGMKIWASSLPKANKTVKTIGKAAAGVGGGLALSKLLNNRKNNSNESGLTDEEIQYLINYYGGNL